MNPRNLLHCGTGVDCIRRDMHDGHDRIRRTPASLPFDRTVM